MSFDPSERITVAKAIRHPWLSAYQDDEEEPDPEEVPEVAGVVQRARHGAEDQQQGALQRAYPRDFRRGVVREQLILVVGLEDAKRVDDAPRDAMP